MKNICQFTLTLVLMLGLLSSCDNGIVEKQSQAPDLHAKIEVGNQVPENMTQTPMVMDLKDLSDNVVGTLDVFNDANYVYLRQSFAHGWQLKSCKVFVGNHSDVPKVNGGMMDLEEFPLQMAMGTPEMVSTISLNRSNLTSCYDVCIWFHAVQLNFFGQEVAQIDGWASGNPILNGFYFNHCPSNNSNISVDRKEATPGATH